MTRTEMYAALGFRPLAGLMFRNPISRNPHSYAAQMGIIGADGKCCHDSTLIC